ncbi:MAG: IclR family transcriptional regulator [Deltaproteobacteria bacterium]|nr:MAG: IclR family transcriptional regulator [Deltaproteobacteria bacterium]
MRGRSTKAKTAVVHGHDDRSRSDYEIRSVTKALDLLEAICEDEAHEPGGDEEVRVTELSKRLGMSKSAVFRLLATFENRGYVERIAETGIYRVGVNAFEVGRRLLLRMGLLRHARPVMEELCRQCNEAIYLAIRRGNEFLFIDLVESAQQVKIASLVGRRFPLASAAPGQVMLAYSEAGSAEAGEDGGLSDIRARGYCLEQGGLGDMVGCLAAPFFDQSGNVAGVICVVGPTYRMPEAQVDSWFLPLLKNSSEAISSKLGFLKPYAGNVRL